MQSVPLPFLSKITLLWTRAREPGPVSPVKVDSPLPFPWTQRGEIYNRKEFAVIRLYYFKERADGTPLPEDAQEMTWEEVSFQIDKGLKTVIRWRNEIINDMAICLFGIDAAIQAGTNRKKKE